MSDNAIDKLLHPDNLKCDNSFEPVGIDNPNPSFSWQIISPARNKLQKAYRIIVSSDKDLAKSGIGDMWDTNKVLSDQQFGIRYEGLKLKAAEKYWWRVMVWDEKDNFSYWSDIASFVTGFFSLYDWPARWFDPSGHAIFARKDFVVDPSKEIKHAFLYTAALGSYCNSFQLHLNGQVLGDYVLFPGPTEYFRALYQGHEVTEKLKAGDNTVGFIYTRKISLVLVIRYKDGSSDVITTDGSWKLKDKGPYVNLPYLNAPGFMAGRHEEYDARLEFENWNMPGFDDSDWKPYKWEGWWTGPLYLKAGLVPCKIIKTFKPCSIVEKDGGKAIVDFGQNMSGFVRMNVEGPSGTKVVIRYAEKLDSKGNLDPSSYTSADPEYSNVYILKGKGKEYYQPAFMYTGFRYVEVTGYPGKLTDENIEACYVHSDVVNGSYFECSSEELNRLQSCAVNSFLSNLINIPTDCPGRERRGWTADAFVVSEAECINFDMLNLFYRWFNDYTDCQLKNGWIPVELPLSTSKAIEVIWPCASVLIPWDVYKAYGDMEFLKKYYALMKGYVDFLTSVADEYYSFNPEINICFGDWVSVQSASKRFIASVYYYGCAVRLSKIAWILGNSDDQEKYEDLALKIKSCINNKYLKHDGNKYYYDNNSQSANAHALYFEVVPEDKKKEVTASLVADIEAKGANTTGFLGTMCILQALAVNGRNDTAYSLVTNKNPGGWLYMINKDNLTTLAEDYIVDTFVNRYLVPPSLNHAFLGGSLSAWFYKHLAGITPVKPGYKKISIKPYLPPDIDYATAEINTVYGKVISEWKKENDEYLHLNVEIPVNTTANVYIPSNNPETILEGGVKISGINGMEYEDNGDGYIVIKLGSGKYSFVSQY